MKIEKEKIIQLIMLKNKKMLLLINKNEFLKKVKAHKAYFFYFFLI